MFAVIYFQDPGGQLLAPFVCLDVIFQASQIDVESR